MPKNNSDLPKAKLPASSTSTKKKASAKSKAKSKPIKRSKTFLNLPLIISEELRESILNGDLPIGAHLKQEEIAKRFDSSLIPVREALRTLETEGLITFIPNRGAIVSLLDVDKVCQRFETRLIMELGAIQLSVPHLTDEDLALAEAAMNAMDDNDSAHARSIHNHEFHQILNSRCNNEYLLEQITLMHRSIDRYLRHFLTNEDYNRMSQEHHHKIFKEAAARNAEGAAECLKIHLKESLALVEALR